MLPVKVLQNLYILLKNVYYFSIFQCLTELVQYNVILLQSLFEKLERGT